MLTVRDLGCLRDKRWRVVDAPKNRLVVCDGCVCCLLVVIEELLYMIYMAC